MLLNRERAKDRMTKHNLEALIASSPANVLYTSNLCPYGQAFALLPLERDVEPAIIAPISGATPVVLMSPPWISDVRYYGEFYTNTSEVRDPMTDPERKMVRAQESWEKKKEKDPIALVLAVLKEREITNGKIGVDESSLPSEHSIWRKLKNTLPRLETVPARDIFRDIRMVKSEEEVERIQEATRITEKAWGAALEQTKEGMTEKEFAEIYQHTIISEQGTIMSWMGMYGAPIAFGCRTAFTDVAQPSGYRLKKGDLVRFDGGCGYMGYICDMARTAVLGQPSEKQRKYYNAILKGEQIAMEIAKPGAKPSEIFRAAVQSVREEGIPHYQRHHTGHGIGIEEYDPPLIGPNVHTPLEEGMILCFETPYYEIGWGGPMVEDIVVIGNRPRVLTRFSSELREI
jgi:Xaa-Pro aminopeptidase